MDSIAEDLLKLLSADETAPVSSTVASLEYRLRVTVRSHCLCMSLDCQNCSCSLFGLIR